MFLFLFWTQFITKLTKLYTNAATNTCINTQKLTIPSLHTLTQTHYPVVSPSPIPTATHTCHCPPNTPSQPFVPYPAMPPNPHTYTTPSPTGHTQTRPTPPPKQLPQHLLMLYAVPTHHLFKPPSVTTLPRHTLPNDPFPPKRSHHRTQGMPKGGRRRNEEHKCLLTTPGMEEGARDGKEHGTSRKKMMNCRCFIDMIM